MITQTIITLAAIWILFAIILPFIIFPNFYLRNQKVQKTKYIKQIANKLKDKSKEKTAKNILKFINQNYIGVDKKYKVSFYHKNFKSNVEKNLKQPKQFLSCHLQNLIARDLLINSGQFKNNEIERHCDITKYATAHQYLTVKVNGQKFKIDPFYKQLQKLK